MVHECHVGGHQIKGQIYITKMKRLEEEGEAKMAQLLTLRPPITAVRSAPSTRTDSAVLSCCPKTLNPKWAFLQQKLKCNGRFSCLFSNNRKQVPVFSSFFSIPTFILFCWFLHLGTFWALIFRCFWVEISGFVLVCLGLRKFL